MPSASFIPPAHMSIAAVILTAAPGPIAGVSPVPTTTSAPIATTPPPAVVSNGPDAVPVAVDMGPVPDGFYATVAPNYKTGTKWTRRITSSGLIIDDTIEVLSVSGQTAHLRQTESSSHDFDVSITSNPVLILLPGGLDPTNPSPTFRLAGTETVIVPAGTFTDCAKLIVTGVESATPYHGVAWLKQGAGVIKLVASADDTPPVVTTQVLTGFVIP